jgi:RHS repeat-associated protein
MSMTQVIGDNNRFTVNGYGYDAAGNVLNDGITTGCGTYGYTWNAEEQMTCAAGSTYTYDGDGIRVEKTGGNATPTMYWGAGNLAESNTSGALTSEYIFANGKRIARRDIATGSVYYYFADMLGSTSVLATASGGLENESDYYPFGGESVVTQNLANQHYKFEGKERDSESGNDYFGARFSNSNMGRFMSPDWANKPEPVPYSKLGSPQTLNLYAFVGNKPESSPDLDGHEDSAPGGDAYNSTAGQAQLAFEEGGSPAAAAQSYMIHSFAKLWASYPSHGAYNSDPNSAGSIWHHIGGKVEDFGKYLAEHGEEANTCALRMSDALNQSGLSIPKQSGSFKGADGKNYLMSVSTVEGFLTKALGSPTVMKGGSFSGPARSSGIVAFNVPQWHPGATGHLSLWNGSALVDRQEEGYDRWTNTGAIPQSSFFWGVQ